MGRTSIEWAQFSVNPIRARDRETGKTGHWCEKVSPGCAQCYSSELQKFRFHGHPFEARFRDKVKVYFEPKALGEVLRRRAPTRWFWCDMTDLFGYWVSDQWIFDILKIMVATPQHTHLVLTKRPERMLATIPEMYKSFRYHFAAPGPETPLRNLHLGVSVENQETADERIPLLLQTPAAVRWVSYEPALGPVDFRAFTYCPEHDFDSGFCVGRCPSRRKLDWLVVGGESGAHSRPFDLAWARQTIDQCRHAGVACFVKQLGSHPHNEGPNGRMYCWAPQGLWQKSGGCGADSWSRRLILKDRKGADMTEWPAELRVRDYPHLSP